MESDGNKGEKANKAVEKAKENISAEAFKLCLWVIDVLEMSHEAGFFDTGVATLRARLREQVIQAQARSAVLEAEGKHE